MQQVKKMGGLGSLVKMLPGIPGVGKMSDLEVDDDQIRRLEAIIRSMTPAERADPRSINGSRRTRIARGSGMRVRDVNDLIKQFEQARKMMRQMMKAGGKRGGLPGLN
jgi:signal recognition particle subunit SRP54